MESAHARAREIDPEDKDMNACLANEQKKNKRARFLSQVSHRPEHVYVYPYLRTYGYNYLII